MTWVIDAALPAGLSFDASTGIISGTPATISPATVYNVTATDGTGASSPVPVSIEVDPAPLTITANAQSKIYGTTFSVAGTEFTASGLVNGDAVTSVTLTSSGAAATATVGGSPYTIVPSAAVGSGLSNYAITYTNGSMTVNTATLTITANDQTKTYGFAFTFAGTEFTTTGLKNTDAVTGATITSTGAPATATVAGSTYPIIPSAAVGSGLSNYAITYTNGSMTVNAAPLTITANAQTKTYGFAFTFAGTEFTTTGLKNTDAVTSATITSAGAPATATVTGSPYPIVPGTATGSGLANYIISHVNGAMTVNTAPLTITADAQTKTYGFAFTFAGTEFTTTGLKNTDAVTGATITSTGAPATATVAGSTYPIIPSAAAGSGLSNYSIIYVNGTMTVSAATLTITGITANSKVYDRTTTASFTGGTLNGVSPGDAGNVGFSPSGTFASANVGTGIVVTSTTTLTGSRAGNYTLTQPTGLTANIAAKTLTFASVLANSKTYDATTNATITATLNGVITGDAVTFNGTGTFATANVGTAIAVTSTSTLTGAQNGNYTFTQPTGLTANITPASLTVSLPKPTPYKTYDGTTVATLGTGTLSGLQGADAANVTLGGTPVGTFNTASAGSGRTITVTGYTISGTAAGNYTFTQPTIGGVKISTAPLTITANDVSKVYGTTLSSTAFTAAGLANGETIGSVTIAYGTARLNTAAVGTYTGQATPSLATGGTFSTSNYSITYTSGAIIVGSAPFDWTGANSTDWATPGNWTSAGIVQTANYPGFQETTDIADIGVNNSFTNNPNIAATLPNSLAGINFGTGPGTINLTVNSGVTLAVSGNFTLTGTETVNMTATNPTLNIGGNYSAASGTTFNFGGSNPMTVSGTTTNGGTFNQSGTGLVTMTGATSNSGTINQTSTGNMVFTGNFANSGSGSVFKQTGTGSLTFSGTLTNAGTFTQGGGPVTIGGVITNTGTLNVGTSTFTVTGDFTNSGTYTQGTGTIVFTNPKNQFLNDASSTGTTFTNVTIANGPNTKIQSGKFGIASTGVLTLSATPGNVTKVTVVSSLTLYSDAKGSATVAAMCSTCKMNGSVTVQRYIAGGVPSARGYRLLSPPVFNATNATSKNNIYSIKYLLDSTYISGTAFPSTTTNSHSKTGNPSLYLFRENLPPFYTTFLNSDYRGIESLASDPYYLVNTDSEPGGTLYDIPVGNGYLFFFRGGPGTINPFTVGNTPLSATLTTTGSLNQGNITVTNWYNESQGQAGLLWTTTNNGNTAQQGMNLVGNPYPSTIDWNNFNGNTNIISSGLSGEISLLNPGTAAGAGNYTYYLPASGLSNMAGYTGLIASGEGFFVQTTSNNAVLTFTENAKTNNQALGASLFLANKRTLSNVVKQQIRLEMLADSINLDATLISFSSNTHPGYVIGEDAAYRSASGKVNIASFAPDNTPLAIDQLPLAANGDTINLKVGATASGNYLLKAETITGIPQFYDIWLQDAATRDSVNLRNTGTYNFTVTLADTTTFGSKRFKLVLKPNPAFFYKLLSFDGQKTPKRQVQLTWTTQNETDHTQFSIERSNDGGKTFTDLGDMTSTGAGTYSFTDPDPLKGDNQYYLKTVDLFGNVTLSNIVDEQFQDNGNDKGASLALYPNPVVNTVSLTIVPKSQAKTTYSIQISNSTGLVVKSATTSDVNWQSNVSDLLVGSYLVQVVDNKNNSIIGQVKFVKL